MSTPVYCPLRKVSGLLLNNHHLGLTEVVTLPFPVHVTQKKDAKDHSDHIELREDQATTC